MGRFVGGTDMPWHAVDRIYCPPGFQHRARQVTEAPDDFPVIEHPFLDGAGHVLVLARPTDLAPPWPLTIGGL